MAIPPCRLADTRGNGFTGPFGQPAPLLIGPTAYCIPISFTRYDAPSASVITHSM